MCLTLTSTLRRGTGILPALGHGQDGHGTSPGFSLLEMMAVVNLILLLAVPRFARGPVEYRIDPFLDVLPGESKLDGLVDEILGERLKESASVVSPAGDFKSNEMAKPRPRSKKSFGFKLTVNLDDGVGIDLQPLGQIVLVAVTSAHRGEGFQACEFLMDYLKTQAPFWKKEQTPEGARWVDARVTDDAAWAKWGIEAHNG